MTFLQFLFYLLWLFLCLIDFVQTYLTKRSPTPTLSLINIIRTYIRIINRCHLLILNLLSLHEQSFNDYLKHFKNLFRRVIVFFITIAYCLKQSDMMYDIFDNQRFVFIDYLQHPFQPMLKLLNLVVSFPY